MSRELVFPKDFESNGEFSLPVGRIILGPLDGAGVLARIVLTPQGEIVLVVSERAKKFIVFSADLPTNLLLGFPGETV